MRIAMREISEDIVSATGSNDQRGGRGRACQGNGCFGPQGGQSGGRGRDGRGRGRGSERRNNSNDANSGNNAPADHQFVVSDITEHGPQNGRSFGRGAYT